MFHNEKTLTTQTGQSNGNWKFFENLSGWTTEKENSVVISEELEQSFQTVEPRVEPQESKIIFETNHFVFEEPKISCHQIESYTECTKEKQPTFHSILNGLQKPHSL